MNGRYIVFPPFAIDTRDKRVKRDGADISGINPKEVRILIFIIERRGEIVRVSDLGDLLDHHKYVPIAEQTGVFRKYVSALRTTMGKKDFDAYVRTIGKVRDEEEGIGGYCFEGKVTYTDDLTAFDRDAASLTSATNPMDSPMIFPASAGLTESSVQSISKKVLFASSGFDRPVYCADMTQLIAGDAYLAGLATGRTEHMAESAFEYLTTILCNDTPIHFAKPKTLNLKTPIIRAWHEASLELSEKKSLPKRQLPAAAADRHEVMSAAFTKWVKDDRYREASGYTNAELLADWTTYHLGNNDLLEMYWSNNTPDEMMNALDAFRTVQGSEKRNDGVLDTVLAASAVLPDKISRSHWGRRPRRDFYPAWAYWNFAKGYRYILQIPNSGAYVCHWLREDACIDGVKYETIFGKRDLLKGLFPWGFVLGEIAQLLKIHTSADAMHGAIMELRRYTKENLDHLSVFEEPPEDKLDRLREKTAEFMQGALARIAPSKWEAVFQGKRLENIVLVPYIVKQLGLEMSFSEMRTGLDLVLASEADPARETQDAIITETLVRLSRYRKTARGFVARYEDKFESFWQERGWDHS